MSTEDMERAELIGRRVNISGPLCQFYLPETLRTKIVVAKVMWCQSTAFKNSANKFGYASAVAIVLFLIVATVTLLLTTHRFSKR
jgi:ABC-type spermidine/putrescine transport system permease subunit I